jgi:hypothetical protein
MSKMLVTLIGAAAIAALVTPASAQRAANYNQSWEGASYEMQRRGPRSTMRGPMRDGRILVTPGYHGGRLVRAKPRYYGMWR